MANALQAVLDKASTGKNAEAPPPPATPRQLAKTEAPAPPRPASRVRRAAPPAAKEEGEEKFFRPARVGKRFVGAHFDPKVARQLKMLAAEDDRTIRSCWRRPSISYSSRPARPASPTS